MDATREGLRQIPRRRWLLHTAPAHGSCTRAWRTWRRSGHLAAALGVACVLRRLVDQRFQGSGSRSCRPRGGGDDGESPSRPLVARSSRGDGQRTVACGTIMMRAMLSLLVLSVPAAQTLRALPVAAPGLRTHAACSFAPRAPVVSLAHRACDDSTSSDGEQQRLVPQRLASWRQALQRRWRGVLGAVVLSSATMVTRFPTAGPVPAHASTVATKAVKKTTKTAAIKRKKAKKSDNGALGTVVMIGGIGYWAWSSASKEDEEEQVRIKEETEKLTELAKEFTDIDEGVTADADLLASLKKRLGDNATKTEGGDDVTGSDGGSSPGDSPSGDSGGGAAVLEPPSASVGATDDPELQEADAPDLPAQADIDALNKMFGMGDADK